MDLGPLRFLLFNIWTYLWPKSGGKKGRFFKAFRPGSSPFKAIQAFPGKKENEAGLGEKRKAEFKPVFNMNSKLPLNQVANALSPPCLCGKNGQTGRPGRQINH